MGEHFQERVLDGLVGVVRVAQVVEGDADGAALLACHQFAEPLARTVALAGDDERLDGAGQLRVA